MVQSGSGSWSGAGDENGGEDGENDCRDDGQIGVRSVG